MCVSCLKSYLVSVAMSNHFVNVDFDPGKVVIGGIAGAAAPSGKQVCRVSMYCMEVMRPDDPRITAWAEVD